MLQSKIIQSLYDSVNEKKMVEEVEYTKQFDELGKWERILMEYIGDDKNFNEIFLNYTIEEGCLGDVISRQYFREGFLCGARLALEICGFERAEE
ncbi:MAG: hypothetical protein K2L70_05315 [Clostridia bacterium]|nr:hypothetical protein [Clostridia bacterium]